MTNEASEKVGDKAPILVSVAWPYANGPFHVGHVAGVYLPADIFARFQRARGREVLMVSGSDCHGAPITIRADRENRTPLEVIEEFHASFIKTFEKLNIEFDLFTKTYTDNHYAVTQDMFLHLLERGFIYRETMTGTFSESQGRFLPDRYVEGECPNCHYARARGDQCDNCGKLLDPKDLINPYSVLDKQPVTFKETEHFFLDLAKLEPALLSWLDGADRSYWRNNTVSFTRNWLKEGLRGRAITRDLDWGVPIPLEGDEWKNKRIYVWFDAVIGYLSASKEWAQRRNEPQAWQKWWSLGDKDLPQAKGYYFLGKDNIPFHTIIWPAMLIGYGELNLPFDVPAAEFMNLEGDKMSTSRNFAVWLPDIEERYQPDLIRYYMTAIAPETRDSNWNWSEFVAKVNGELVGTYGNLVNRVLNLTSRYFAGKVPQPAAFDQLDREVLDLRQKYFDKVTDLIEGVHLRKAFEEVLALASEGNTYLERRKPWETSKTDMERTATTLYVALQLLNTLKLLAYPFLPFSSEKLHSLLGYPGGDAEKGTYSGVAKDGEIVVPTTAKWEFEDLAVGQQLSKPEILFTKLDPSVAEEELARLQLNTLL